jgi:hypothetical protein
MNANAQRPAFEARHDASVRHDAPWHALPAEIVLDRVGGAPGGLSAAEAATRLAACRTPSFGLLSTLIFCVRGRRGACGQRTATRPA